MVKIVDKTELSESAISYEIEIDTEEDATEAHSQVDQAFVGVGQ